jgi:hypothetical protein
LQTLNSSLHPRNFSLRTAAPFDAGVKPETNAQTTQYQQPKQNFASWLLYPMSLSMPFSH